MKAKEYLRQAWVLKDKIEAKEAQIIRLQGMAERATGTYEAMRVSGTSSLSRLEDAVVKITDLGDELGTLMLAFEAKYREISAAIEKVPDPVAQQLLAYRYLCFMPWEEVAVKMGYSYRHTTKLHGRILQRWEDDLECPC